jgi:hypothetical protein
MKIFQWNMPKNLSFAEFFWRTVYALLFGNILSGYSVNYKK